MGVKYINGEPHQTVVQINSNGDAGGDIGTAADAVATTDVGTFSLIALVKRLIAKFPASLGAKAASASLSIAPATDANMARELYTTVTPMAVVTPAAGGDTWTQMGALVCSSFDLVNTTGVTLEYKRGAAGTVFIPVPDGTSRLIQGIVNANAIFVRRVDRAAVAVTAVGEAFAV